MKISRRGFFTSLLAVVSASALAKYLPFKKQPVNQVVTQETLRILAKNISMCLMNLDRKTHDQWVAGRIGSTLNIKTPSKYVSTNSQS